MIATNRFQPDPHTWPPETFSAWPKPPPRDPVPWWQPMFGGLVLVFCGACVGFGMAAGWAAWRWMWN